MGGDPFEEAYAIKSAIVSEVASYILERWKSGHLSAVAFDQLEEKFGGHMSNRMDVVHIIEYARIGGLFDDPLYIAIEAKAPMEANSFLASFSPEDVYFG